MPAPGHAFGDIWAIGFDPGRWRNPNVRRWQSFTTILSSNSESITGFFACGNSVSPTGSVDEGSLRIAPCFNRLAVDGEQTITGLHFDALLALADRDCWCPTPDPS